MDIQGHTIDQAIACLRAGGVVAFPTETYYGLAIDPDSYQAVKTLYSLKKRPVDKPILLLIERREQLDSIAASIPAQYLPLMEKYWPGPLTLVFPVKKGIYPFLTGHTQTVGVRISPHPIAAELVKRMGKPVTATSANISGMPPAKTVAEVVAMFSQSVNCILDGGETAAGLCSTVLEFLDGKLRVIRQGQIDIPF